MKNLYYFLAAGVIFISCQSGNTKEDKEKENRAKEKAIEEKNDSFRKNIINDLKHKYNITYVLDTVHFNYSIQFKPVINSNFQLIANYQIRDIFEKGDSTYVSIITNGEIEDFTFSVTKEQIDLFLKHRYKSILVVRLKNIMRRVNSEQKFYSNGELIEFVKFTPINSSSILETNHNLKDTNNPNSPEYRDR